MLQNLHLFLLGAIGIATLVADLPKLRDRAEQLGRPLPPNPVVQVFIVTAQPLIMLCLAIWAGHVFAADLGLVSWLHGDPTWIAHDPNLMVLAIIGTAAASAVIVAYGDNLLSKLGRGDWEELRPRQKERHQDLVRGVLYGGLTEEILLRWGMLSIVGAGLAWLGIGHEPAMLGAVAISAFVFALAHLPAVGAMVMLTPAITVRTILLNLVPGLAFGLLAVLFALEAAMLAHAMTHLILHVLPRRLHPALH